MQDHVAPTRLHSLSGRAPGYARESKFITHNDIKRFIKRYARTIVAATLLGVLIAGIYVFMAIPRFTAYTQIIIDPSLPQTMQQSQTESLFSLDNAQVESQLEVLRSEKIAATVINELNLQEVPEFGGIDPGLWPLSGAPPRISGFPRERLTLARFQAGLDVRRVGMSYAIAILFTSRDPQLAAKIANATAKAYINEQIAVRAQAARQGGVWLEERIDELRRQMNNAALEAQEFRAKRDYRIARNRENGRADAEGERDDAARRRNTMEELDSTAQTYRRIYESYLMAYTESVQKQSYPITNARVITEATPPLGKSHPRTKLILAFGALMGAVAGLGIAFFRYSIDRSVWGPRQIRDEIGVECLASIPSLTAPRWTPFSKAMFGVGETIKRAIERPSTAIEGSRDAVKAAASLAKRALKNERSPAPRDAALDAVLEMPFSGFCHGIKTLKTAIALAGRTRPIRCLAITSALPNEGKTTICANLSALFAVTGARTLLVDADLRNASLTRAMAPDAELGLIDAITSGADPAKCIVRANDSGLDLLPAFGSTATVYSDDVLGSEKAQQLLRDLQTAYDIIILELPPLTASLDGLAMGPLLDCTILVAEYGKTPVPILAEGIHLLRNAQVEILGVALNKVDTSTVQYGDVAASYMSYGSHARHGRALSRAS